MVKKLTKKVTKTSTKNNKTKKYKQIRSKNRKSKISKTLKKTNKSNKIQTGGSIPEFSEAETNYLIKFAMNKNIPKAQFELGQYFINNIDKFTEEQKKQICDFYNKLTNIYGEYYRGMFEFEGICKERNLKDAFVIFKQMADSDSLPEASLMVGKYYAYNYEGIDDNITEDEAAVGKGYENLRDYYDNQATMYFTRASEKVLDNYESGPFYGSYNVEAIYLLALFYVHQMGIRYLNIDQYKDNNYKVKDPIMEAIKYFILAAKCGNKNAIKTLGKEKLEKIKALEINKIIALDIDNLGEIITQDDIENFPKLGILDVDNPTIQPTTKELLQNPSLDTTPK